MGSGNRTPDRRLGFGWEFAAVETSWQMPLIPNSRKLKSGLLAVENYLHPEILPRCGSADVYRFWASDLDESPSLDDGLSNYRTT